MKARGCLLVLLCGMATVLQAQDLTHPTRMGLPESDFVRPDPTDFELTLDIPVGNGIDRGAADLITTFAGRVPSDPDPSVINTLTAAFGPDREYLIVTATSAEPFQTPDVFPEFGELFTFGKQHFGVNHDTLTRATFI